MKNDEVYIIILLINLHIVLSINLITNGQWAIHIHALYMCIYACTDSTFLTFSNKAGVKFIVGYSVNNVA